MSTFTVGINTKITGKCDPDLLSYSKAWSPALLSLPQLADHISHGHPWMPARLDEGQRRFQHYANHAELLALDIDGGLTIAQAMAHPVVAAHCGLGIETASSGPELNKFRLVFVLPRPVEGWKTIRICNRYLAHLVGTADPSCKDASRYFFGAPGRVPFLLNEAATLPSSFVEDAIAWHDAIEAQEKARAEQARRAWEEYQRQHPGQDTDALLLGALNAISPDCDYNTWLAIGMALAGMGDQWLSVWDGWSAGGSSYKPGECDRKWQSFRGKRPAPEVVFGIAKKYGWKFPRSAREKSAGKTRKAPKNHASAAAIAESIGHSQGNPVEALKEHYRPTEMAPDFVIQSSGDGLSPEAKAVLDANPAAFVTGMTGSGKTSTILEWTATRIKETPGTSRGLIAPTNNLASGLTVEAAARGIDATLLRDRVGSSAGVSPGLATESLYRESGRSGYVFDEITPQTRRLLQGNLGEAADQNLSAFNKILVSSTPLSLLDANITPEVRAYAESVRREKIPVIKVERVFPEKQPVNVTTYVDHWVRPEGDAKPFYTSGKAAMVEQLNSTIMVGGKVLLLSGGADFANELKQHYRKQRKTNGMRVRVLEVDGDTTPEGVRLEFAADPTAFISKHNYDLVIVTRLAETGANIKNEFDSVCVSLTLGQTATEANQLMSRARCLFQGSCTDLHIYFPGEAGSHPTEGSDPTEGDSGAATLAQSIDWKWQQAQIAKEHQSTLITLAGGLTPGDAGAIKALGYVVANQSRLGLPIETLAKMRAREAAEKHWRMDYLVGMLSDRGFNVAAEPTTDDGTATKKWLARGSDTTAPGLLTAHREANKKTKANCRARGNRLQSEYADRYQDKLSDPREQGWILRQKRQQLKDAGDFPLSPLDTDWHLANIENDRLRPQAKCRALLMVPGEGVAILRQRTVAEIMGSRLGFLELHKRLHRHEIHRMALMQSFSASTLLTGILNNRVYAEWTEATPGAAQLAQMIRQHRSDLEMYCAREYGTPFVWDEKSDIALINKFWKLILGFQPEKRGQRTVEGNRVRLYGLGELTELAKEMTDSHVMALLTRLDSIECESGNWDAASPEWESIQELLTSCTLKSETLDSQDFSVQATPPAGELERPAPETAESTPPEMAESPPMAQMSIWDLSA